MLIEANLKLVSTGLLVCNILCSTVIWVSTGKDANAIYPYNRSLHNKQTRKPVRVVHQAIVAVDPSPSALAPCITDKRSRSKLRKGQHPTAQRLARVDGNRKKNGCIRVPVEHWIKEGPIRRRFACTRAKDHQACQEEFPGPCRRRPIWDHMREQDRCKGKEKPVIVMLLDWSVSCRQAPQKVYPGHAPIFRWSFSHQWNVSSCAWIEWILHHVPSRLRQWTVLAVLHEIGRRRDQRPPTFLSRAILQQRIASMTTPALFGESSTESLISRCMEYSQTPTLYSQEANLVVTEHGI